MRFKKGVNATFNTQHILYCNVRKATEVRYCTVAKDSIASASFKIFIYAIDPAKNASNTQTVSAAFDIWNSSMAGARSSIVCHLGAGKQQESLQVRAVTCILVTKYFLLHSIHNITLGRTKVIFDDHHNVCLHRRLLW